MRLNQRNSYILVLILTAVAAITLIVFMIVLSNIGIRPAPIKYAANSFPAHDPVRCPGQWITWTPILTFSDNIERPIQLHRVRSWENEAKNRRQATTPSGDPVGDNERWVSSSAENNNVPQRMIVPNLPHGDYAIATTVSSEGYKQSGYYVYFTVPITCGNG